METESPAKALLDCLTERKRWGKKVYFKEQI
jgi:hypothetical protein